MLFTDSKMLTSRWRPTLTERAVYGLPELNADAISSAALVANPGCYATSVILALAPLLSAGLVDCDRGIISDSKSGVSGAGKEPTARTHFVSVADNFSAYSVFGHRHTGEILEQLRLHSCAVDLYAAPVADSARNSVHDLCLPETRNERRRRLRICLQDFYQGQALGARVYRAEPCPRFSSPRTRITATSDSAWRGMGAGWCWFRVSTTCSKVQPGKPCRI